MRPPSQLAADIRGPLAGMIELADLLLESGLTARQRECALVLRRAAADLLRRVEATLDGSDIAAARESYEFHIREALVAAVSCGAGIGWDKRLPVSIACDPELPDTLVADGRRIVYLAAEMVAVVAAHGAETVLRAFADGPGALVLDAGPVEGAVNGWFAAELASRMGGDLQVELREDGRGRVVARIPTAMGARAGV